MARDASSMNVNLIISSLWHACHSEHFAKDLSRLESYQLIKGPRILTACYMIARKVERSSVACDFFLQAKTT